MVERIDALATWLQSLPPWQGLAVLVVASLVGAWLATVVSVRIVRRLVVRTETGFDDIVFDELRTPVAISVALVGFYLSGDWLVFGADAALALRAGATTLAVLVWARALIRLGDRVIREFDESSEVADFAPIFENLWSFGIVVGALFAVLKVWNVDITPLLASAGIAGVAIGFAARDTVANFFGSIALYVDDTYTVGDYVVLDSGEAGTVIDISIRSTRLITRDNVVITVPNSVLNSARIINQSAPRPHMRVRVPVGVAYGSDLDEVEEILLDVAAAEDLVVQHPGPKVRFRRFGDSALEYELLAYVANPMRDARAIHALNRAIYERFADAGVEIPFPQRVVSVSHDGADVPVESGHGHPEDAVPVSRSGPESTDGEPSDEDASRSAADEPAEDGTPETDGQSSEAR